MKTVSLILAAMLCTAGTGTANEGLKTSTSEQKIFENQILGSQAIAKIRADYEAGRYDDFLKEMDASFETASENGSLSSFSSAREGKKIDLKWIVGAKKAQQERNSLLLQAVDGDNSLFAQKVRSAAMDVSSQETEDAILKLAEFRQMLPNTGSSKDENALIDLDLEYEYKSIHLDKPSLNGQQTPDRREKHYVLKMNQMDKILAASQGFSDEKLKNQVFIASENQDERMSQSWDQYDLNTLTNGKAKPTNPTEDKVVLILQSHQEAMTDLARQSLEADHAEKN